jgi:hypothetical protein
MKREFEQQAQEEDRYRTEHEHDGEAKHGNHWYKDGESESWEDTFVEEE